LRQNQFWRKGSFIDAADPPYKYGVYTEDTPMGVLNIPCFRTKVITPLTPTYCDYSECPGASHLMFTYMMDIASEYLDSPVSRQDMATSFLVTSNKIIKSYEPLSRDDGESVPKPLGEPYFLQSLAPSPFVELCALYNTKGLGADVPVYDMINRVFGRGGINATRRHLDIYREFVNSLNDHVGAGASDVSTSNDFIFTASQGIHISFKRSATLLDRQSQPPIPEVSDYELPKISVDVLYTTPDSYVSKEEEILSSNITATKIVPILPCNVGPFIQKGKTRTMEWPSNSDFTEPGAFTETITVGGNSAEYDTACLGLLSVRRRPINIVDPRKLLILSLDPVGVYSAN